MNWYTNVRAAKMGLDQINNRETWQFMENAVAICFNAVKCGHKIMICGNGGSACDAEHFAEELTGYLTKNRRDPIAAMHLGGAGHITCVANDTGFHNVYLRLIQALGQPGDVLIGLSTSAQSENVAKALEYAEENGIHTIALIGEAEGRREYTDTTLCFRAPGDTSARIQEVHKLMLHSLAEGIEDACLQ